MKKHCQNGKIWKDIKYILEFDQARGAFEIDLETAKPDELKTLYCDYDSEKERRYSEIESEEESNSDDNVEKEEKRIQPSGYTSSANSSSTSSSESSSKGPTSKPKRKLSKKKSSLSVTMNKYNIDKEIDSQKQNDKYNMFSQDLKRISSESRTLSKQSEKYHCRQH